MNIQLEDCPRNSATLALDIKMTSMQSIDQELFVVYYGDYSLYIQTLSVHKIGDNPFIYHISIPTVNLSNY